MKANCWMRTNQLRVLDVPDPKVLNPRDAVVRITSTAICGSDLHLLDGFVPTMEPGDILGHEFMGEIVELGPGVKNRKVGDRVVVAFPIACGNCLLCKEQLDPCCFTAKVVSCPFITPEKFIVLPWHVPAAGTTLRFRAGATVAWGWKSRL